MDVHELTGPLDDYLLLCLGAGKSLKTIDHYSRVIKAFIREFSTDEVTPHTINAYLARLRETRRSSTANSYCRALRTFFNYLLAEGLLDHNPMANTKTPPVTEEYPEVLDETEAAALIRAAKQNDRDHAVILFLLDTGARASEVTGLKVGDIDITRRSAKVFGKGRRSRAVFFNEKTARALARWMSHDKRGNPKDWLFPSQRGGRLTASGLRQMIKRTAKRAGLENTRIYTHLLRHTFATYYVKQGGDAHTLTRLLGHKSIKTAQIYVNLVSKDLEEAHKKFSPVGRLETLDKVGYDDNDAELAYQAKR